MQRGQSAVLAELAVTLARHHPEIAPDAERPRQAVEGFVAWLEQRLPAKQGPSGIGVEHIVQTDHKVLVCVKNQAAGEKWIEWRVGQTGSLTSVSQTVFFCPRGLPGFLYWYLLYPLHLAGFRRSWRAILKESRP